MIRIENLTFRYNDEKRPALNNINLQIGDGEFVLVTGPSGGGKSSLCRCLNGLIPHFYGGEITGRIEVQGLDTLKHPTSELANRVGMIFQDPENQLVNTDVEREIAFGLENLAFPREIIAKRIVEALDTLNISDLRHRRLYELSGGEKQKVAIASVLALHPEVLVLDEPTSELDPKSSEEVLSIAERLNDELGITVIMIEHRLDRVLQHADRLVVLKGGEIIADGSIREVLNRSYSAVTGAGIGVPPIIQLARRAEEAGIRVSDTPLTVKEGRVMLEAALNGGVRESLRGEICSFITTPPPDSSVVPIGVKENRDSFQNDNFRTPSGIKGMGLLNNLRPVIEVNKLWHVYPDGPPALKGISLSIKAGEFVAIMGRNASGKTTLIKHFNGLLKPTRGTVLVDGLDTRKVPVTELARKVGFVFQNPNDHLFADTVEEEIGFTLRNLRTDSERAGALVGEALEKFRLEKYKKHYPRSLSSGEKQRVALASVLAGKPDILVLDEPTRGLNYRLKSELMAFLKEYTGQGNTVVLVTHDVETAAEHAERVVLLSEGEIVIDGKTRDVLSRALLFSPQINRLVQAFGRYGLSSDILTVDELIKVIK